MNAPHISSIQSPIPGSRCRIRPSEASDALFALSQGPPFSAEAAVAAQAAADAGPPTDATAMKRLFDAVVYGIPERLHVDCAACLFWRGAALGAGTATLLGVAVWWLLD
jgi:hypothetical protein